MLADGGPGLGQGGPRLVPLEGALDAVGAEPVEQHDGVVAGLLPELRVQQLEEVADPGIPGPGQVQGKVLELVDQRAEKLHDHRPATGRLDLA